MKQSQALLISFRTRTNLNFGLLVTILFLHLVTGTAVASPGLWTQTASMIEARSRHTATLLPDGRVLVVGGIDEAPGALGSAELYDGNAQSWLPAANLNRARSRHSATLLADGKVLIVGGLGSQNRSIASAELYNPVAGEWLATGRLLIPRHSHTAVLLSDGRVLVAGGVSGEDSEANAIEKTAEIYDPATATWKMIDHMANARFGHAATLLPDGKVLVTGGSGPRTDGVFTKTAEIYDPQAGTWSNVDPMMSPRAWHNAVLLADGTLLVIGGQTLPANERHVTSATERYDSGPGRWRLAGSLAISRSAGPFGATLLLDGKCLVAGGRTVTAEIYNPLTEQWTLTGSMAISRSRHTVTLLLDGSVLASGGENRDGIIAAAEVYTP